MRKIRMTRDEKIVIDAVLSGKLTPVDKETERRIARAVAAYQKDAVLNIRINSNDLFLLKEKARKFGVKYQTFISGILHQAAHV
ncbi:MAG: antitoxin [Candidatus Omnitrophica bacterium]|nr:antitoxin [Candidatus Omnitrophota bacterium]